MVGERGVLSTLEVARAGKTSITGAAREDVKCVCSHVYSDHHRFYLPKLNHTCTIPKVGGNNNFILCGSNIIWPWLRPFGTHGALWEIGGTVAHSVTESNHQSGLGPGTASCPSVSFYWWLSGESLWIKKESDFLFLCSDPMIKLTPTFKGQLQTRAKKMRHNTKSGCVRGKSLSWLLLWVEVSFYKTI